ncbi:tryptophan synthase subunit alpha [Sporolactobacillus inulinus]|uniref:Tryptophan synthase alpha chain n=1 Tax=Sporolactobacillus inulinus CASD TaxID=1069536 RepID=A0A0U1QLH3_9BACL|nr:tryptophan synthase subunit alpha [Sporolactobacillus inulinus]KLI01665.1 tryptophan synthase subunit alpha [Sporolactobacillus inulinus CASD]GEB76142.1 tryptophan synthase alpha chain [Sporolactobacillus inulinus]
MTVRMEKHVTNAKRMLFIPFITAGDPTDEATVALALMLQSLGADALELGIPYSDPLADGPVIQAASQRALRHGENLNQAMHLVKEMRTQGFDLPVIIFTYANVLLQFGIDRFFDEALGHEVDGLLVPDLPYEESKSLADQCLEHKISLISLVAPTTSDERLKRICDHAQGFIYCVSSLGVTGMRKTFHPDVYPFLERVKQAAQLPVAVGFGISSRDQVAELERYADGFIVGSAIVAEVGQRAEQLADSSMRAAAIQEIKATLDQNLLAERVNRKPLASNEHE